MNQSWRRVLYLVGLGVGSLLFLYQLWNGYQAVVQKALRVSAPALLGVALGIVMVATGLQMIAWSRLMQALGNHLSWRQVVRGYALSFLPRYIPGSIWGYLSRGEWLHRSHNVTYQVSNFGSILEVVGILSASCLTVGIYYASLSSGLSQLVLLIVTALIPFAIWRVLQWVISGHLFRCLFAKVSAVGASFQVTFWNWIAVVMLYLILWLCYGGLIWLLVQALGIPLAGSVIQYSFIFSLAWVVGFVVVFVPAGLGIREVTLSSLLVANIGLLSYQGSAVAIASRLTISIAELVWLLFGLILSRLGNHNIILRADNSN